MAKPITPTRFDRALSSIAPRAAARRLRNKAHFEAIASGAYPGTRTSRHRPTNAFRRAHLRDEDRELGMRNRDVIRLELRTLRRCSGIVFSLLQRFADHVIGAGMTPTPMSGDPKWDAAALDFWTIYERDCDERGRLSAWELQRMAVKSRLIEGETIMARMQSGKVMPLEPERIRTPKRLEKSESIIDGIRIDATGRPTAAYLCRRDRRGVVDPTRYQRLEWPNLIYASTVERIDHLRAVSPLASVLNTLRDLGQFREATLLKAKCDAFQGWAVYSDEPMQPENMDERTQEEEDTAVAATDRTKKDVRIEHQEENQFWYLDSRAKLQSLKSETPNSQYGAFNTDLLTEIAAVAGIPLPVWLLDVKGLTFAGQKGVFELAERTWRIWRRWIVDEYLRPWWTWRVGMAIINKELPPAPLVDGVSQWDRLAWTPPPQILTDIRAEAAANKTGMALGTINAAKIARQQGTTAPALFREKADTIAAAAAEADRLNKAGINPPLTWRDIMNYESPGAQAPQFERPTAAGGKE